jgi:cold shock protein
MPVGRPVSPVAVEPTRTPTATEPAAGAIIDDVTPMPASRPSSAETKPIASPIAAAAVPAAGPVPERVVDEDRELVMASSSIGEAGTVKWFSPEKAYGFIAGDDGTDVFVHQSAIMAVGLRSLPPGQRVSYEEKRCPKGPFAAIVRVAPHGGEERTHVRSVVELFKPRLEALSTRVSAQLAVNDESRGAADADNDVRFDAVSRSARCTLVTWPLATPANTPAAIALGGAPSAPSTLPAMLPQAAELHSLDRPGDTPAKVRRGGGKGAGGHGGARSSLAARFAERRPLPAEIRLGARGGYRGAGSCHTSIAAVLSLCSAPLACQLTRTMRCDGSHAAHRSAGGYSQANRSCGHRYR